MKPLVSIITPCYNGEEFLSHYFESILNQTYSNIELIFVNDGSTDKTDSIARSYQAMFEERGIQYTYIEQENAGQASALNAGLKIIKGKYLLWPDSDDILANDSIEKRVTFLENNPEFRFVRSNGYFFDYISKEKMNRISEMENRFNQDIFLDLILEKTFCSCGCYMIHTEDLKTIYPDMTIYESKAGQNWQLLIPIAGRFLCGFIDEDLYKIAVREGSHSRQKRTIGEEIKRAEDLKEILEKCILLAERYDKDYQYIINVKYLKVFFRIYMNGGIFREGVKIYEQLKVLDEIDKSDYLLYIQKIHPIRYAMYIMSDWIARAYKKILRIVKEK